MGFISCRIAVTGALWLVGAYAAQAQALLDEVGLVAAPAVATAPVPAAQTFTVTQAGSYTVTLTDLQVPAALTSLSVAVASSSATAVQLSAPGGSMSNTVSLGAGTYTVQPLATVAAGSAGSFSVLVTPEGSNTATFQNVWAIAAPGAAGPAGQSSLSTTFTVTDPGNYQLTVTDQAFPAALSSLELIVLPQGGVTPVAPTPIDVTAPIAISQQLVLGAGNYDLFIVAQAQGAALAGLYSVQISGGGSGNSVAYAATLPVGQLTAAGSFTAPSAESVSIQLNDLGYPAGLAGLQGVAVQGAALLGSMPAAGSFQFPATAGTGQIYVSAQPAASGEGSYAAYVYDASSTLLDTAQPVVDNSHFGYAYSTSLAAGGAYQFSVTDFQIPVSLASVAAVTEQTGASASTGIGPSNINPAAGAFNMVVFAQPQAASAAGLFGIELLVEPSGNPAYEATQGVGAAFQSQSVDIAAAGSYLLTFADLGFPADFNQIWLIVTQGPSVVGQVVGGGSVIFNVTTPGTFVLNVLGQTGAGVNYGLYGLDLAIAPPLPTITLTATPGSIISGQSVTLNWSTTNATSCTASGGWTGVQMTSGSQVIAALTSTTMFTLGCSGPGGVYSQSVTVTVTAAPAANSGGGGMAPYELLALALITMLVARQRRAPSYRA